VEDTGGAAAVQAPAGRFWRDRGFWLQFIVQSVVFLFLGMLDVVSAVNAVEPLGESATPGQSVTSDAGTVTGVLLAGGYGISFIGLLLQRRRPETGLAVVAAGSLTAAAAMSPVYMLGAGIVGYEAWFISGYVRRHRRRWLALLSVGAVATALLAVLASVFGFGWGGTGAAVGDIPVRELTVTLSVLVLLVIVSVALCWQLGLGVRRQHERMENLAARAELSAVTERNRIAREMHDIVAHSLTAVIAQADGGRYAGRKDPDKAIEALETIGSTGREALAQMRQLLSVLRDDGLRGTSAAPGVAGVPALVEDARRSGLEVDLQVLGRPREVSPTVGLTVYRTVQESLTNILKHAGRVGVTIVIDWTEPGRLTITVDNSPGTPGECLVDPESAAGGAGGQGLLGLKERARVHGGSAGWGPSDIYPGGWRVTVKLST
jgi:signal transduction histidine kinase